jgi:SAM-dependent methyltransferase
MNDARFRLRDESRKLLLPQLAHALKHVDASQIHRMLDAGCGTGVPTLFLAETFNGHITAIDTDADALAVLKQKIKLHPEFQTVNPVLASLGDICSRNEKYDLLLAEGLLNIIGFENGLHLISGILNPNGYAVIHDEYAGYDNKLKLLQEKNFSTVCHFEVDEDTWKQNFYLPLLRNIEASEIGNKEVVFATELAELKMLKQEPSLFRSVYYVIRKPNLP